MHMLHLRTAPDAQLETQELANGVMQLVEQVCPLAVQHVREQLLPKFTLAEVAGIMKGYPVKYPSKSAQQDYERRRDILKELVENWS